MRPFFEEVKRRNDYPIAGAEIGVSIGVNASDILNGLEIKMLHLVDSYPIYTNESTIAGQKSAKQAAYERFKDNKNCNIIHLDSIQAADLIAPASLDFVYIDACHRYENVKAEIEAWTSKVRVGGMLGGHDFDSREDNYGVYRAVSEWIVPKQIKLYSQNSDWWVICQGL